MIEETDFVINGFKHGFSLEYNGPRDKVQTARNLPLRCGSKVILWNKMMKEVSLKRFAGPFENPPFEYFIQSPVGLVPKGPQGQGQDQVMDTRLIFHLSWPRPGQSANSCTPKELCSVKYKDLDEAIRLCIQTGDKCYLAKSDMKSAFRHLPIRPDVINLGFRTFGLVIVINNKAYV